MKRRVVLNMMAAALLPMALLFFTSAWLELKNGVKASASESANLVHQHLATHIEFLRLVSSQEVMAEGVSLAFFEQVTTALQSAMKLEEHLTDIFVCSPQGEVLASTVAGAVGKKAVLDAAAKKVLQGKVSGAIGPVMVNKGLIPVYAAIRDKEGKTVALLHGLLAVKGLKKEMGLASGVVLANGRGQVFYGRLAGGLALREERTIPLAGWTLRRDLTLGEAMYEVREQLLVLLALAVAVGGVVQWLALGFASRLVRPIDRATAAVQRISKGELDVTLRYDGKDQIGDMVAAFNATLETLRQLAATLTATAGDLKEQATHLLTGASESSYSMGQIAAQVEGLTFKAVWMDEIAQSTQNQGAQTIDALARINEQITQSSQQVAQNQRLSAEGLEAIGSMSRAMDHIVRENEAAMSGIRQLKEATEKVFTAAGLISHIAEQVNLLALNADIEAERAGEHGRGFAVVSREVRQLAGVSSSAAREITQLIRHSQGLVDSVVKEMEQHRGTVEEGARILGQAQSRFAAIQDSMSATGQSYREIAAASGSIQDFSKALGELMTHLVSAVNESSQGTEHISGAVQEVTAATQEVSESAAHLSEMAKKLDEVVAFFRQG